jgi:colanic acid/amylovoran biosynthesis glycosyltransferase
VPRPLCIFVPEIGLVTETFIRWDIRELLPVGTVVVADPPPAGESVRSAPAWDAGDCPSLIFKPQPGDPPPGPESKAAVADFLAVHDVEVVLVEYLDFADRWFDFLAEREVRVWIRGHGVDLSARLRQAQWRQAYRRYTGAAGIIVPNHVAASALTELGLPPEKVHVVRYSVDFPVVATVRDEHVVPCVAVGRLVPKKAPLLVVDAFRRAAERDDRLTLDLVGDGPLMDNLRNYVDDHDLSTRVRLHGRLPHADTLALVRGADVLLHHAITSPEDGDTEGQPLAILEAMAAGVPVIATHHAGIPEVIEHKVNGLLIREHDVAGMATALLSLAADPDMRSRLGTTARVTTEQRHGHDHARRTLLSLFGLRADQPAVTG